MGQKNILLIIIGLLVVIAAYNFWDTQSSKHSNISEKPPGGYAAQLNAERRTKDDFFRTGKESPLMPEDTASFEGLSYFEPDSTWRINTHLTRLQVAQLMPIKMTKGEEEGFKPYARAVFEREGKRHSLLLLEEPGRKMLFLAFKDLTNNTETYAGGRYIDIPMGMIRGDSLLIDFNRAYNPFCAYNYEYTCPIPPAENLLDLAVKVGEKLFKQHRKP